MEQLFYFPPNILSEVQKMCDRVAIIKEGKIIKVEKIILLKESNHKKIKVETKVPVDVDFFDADGVTNLEVTNNTISFLFSGNINLIMRKLSEIELSNVWVDEPDLEEIFLHYYEKEE